MAEPTAPGSLGYMQPHGSSTRDPLLEEATRLAALPTFHSAVREYTIRATAFRRGPRVVNKLISYDKRWRVISYLLYFALDHERYGPAGGATYKRLLDVCTTQLAISPRVLKTALALLQISGYVKTVRNDSDRRSKSYQPTARIFEFVHQWLSYAVNTLDVLEPEMQRARLLREDPEFAKRFLVQAGRARLEDGPIVNRMPNYIAFFGRREGASAVLLAVALSHMDKTDVPSRNEIANRFSISKTQVNTILAEAEAEGFIRFAAGAPRPTELLLEAQRRWISIELATYVQAMRPPRPKPELIPS
jgi:DNA-binding MarR family transcriptional regulator